MSAPATSPPRDILPGDRVRFTPQWEDAEVEAVVTRVFRLGVGLGHIGSYVIRDGNRLMFQHELFFRTFRHEPVEDAAEREARLEAARAHLRAHLAQYPAWADRLAAGTAVHF